MSSNRDFGNSLACWIARKRPLLRVLRPLLPRSGIVRVNGSFRIHVQLADRTGPSFYVNHGGPAAFYHYEEGEKAEILQCLPADGVFVDAGANIGLFSFFVARYFPRAQVFSFEPHPLLFECLSGTKADNTGLGNVTLVQACVGGEDGEVELHLHRTDSGGHSTGADQFKAGEKGSSLTVPIVRLDSWVRQIGLTRLDALKVDIQGAEWLMLEGGRETLARFRPMVLIELDNTELARKPGKLSEYFGPGYRVRRVGDAGLQALESASALAEDGLKRGRLHSNYVLIAAP